MDFSAGSVVTCSYFMASFTRSVLKRYIETTSGPQFHNCQTKSWSTRNVMLTWVSLERRLLACRWAAENSRGPSNSKVISKGCPPNESLCHPTHLLSVQTKEQQASASVPIMRTSVWIGIIFDTVTVNGTLDVGLHEVSKFGSTPCLVICHHADRFGALGFKLEPLEY
jgi:hypothetical protein